MNCPLYSIRTDVVPFHWWYMVQLTRITNVPAGSPSFTDAEYSGCVKFGAKSLTTSTKTSVGSVELQFTPPTAEGSDTMI